MEPTATTARTMTLTCAVVRRPARSSVADHVLGERAAVQGSVAHLREREPRLQQRHRAATCSSV